MEVAVPVGGEAPVQKTILIALLCAMSGATPALAVNTWAGSTADDMAVEQDACAPDAYRFCGGNTVFIFEMENCLKRYMPYLSRSCRKQLSPTDFRKYHGEEPDFFGF
ncbi:hypothetical protein [Methylocystis rosea]|uniref:hypothetical protein n=1 Tax=Methylocystis rosea TaxID=173366 RepID=UPI0012ECAFA1|nr:hypothetical protein [Methylocystis rosea]